MLNYNGLDLLEECLPSIEEAAGCARRDCRISVLDNGSTDSSLDFLRENFPDIQITISENNKFLVSYNDFVSSCEEEVVILLNNDIRLDKNFVDPLVEVLEKYPDSFMAGPQCWTFDKKRFEGSRTKIRFYFGHMQSFTRYPGHEKDMEAFGFSAAVGSVVAFDRLRFLELGGFDDIYLPGRLEDLDICYRGWKKGWKGYYVPDSLAYHKSSAAFNDSFGVKKTRLMAYRNTFLFTWKNIHDPVLVFEHIIFLVPRLLFSVITLNFEYFLGFFQAIGRAKVALRKRKQAIKESRFPDKFVMDMVGF